MDDKIKWYNRELIFKWQSTIIDPSKAVVPPILGDNLLTTKKKNKGENRQKLWYTLEGPLVEQKKENFSNRCKI